MVKDEEIITGMRFEFMQDFEERPDQYEVNAVEWEGCRSEDSEDL